MDKGSAGSSSRASVSSERKVIPESTRSVQRTKHAPFGFMHPTHLEDAGGVPHTITWHSRASRKHRYVAKPTKVHHDVIRGGVRNVVAAGKEVQREIQLRIHHRYSRLKPDLAWDISLWVALSFVLGSAAWIINGFLLFLPLLNEGSQQPTQAAAWGFVGGTAFELGAFLMFVESLNTGHEGLFKKALIGNWSEDPETRKEEKSRFRWFGLASLRDIGFLASVIQLFSATIFWISTLTGLPGVIPGFPSNSSISITDIFFWTPQVIGGSGFIIASTLFMVECQKAWWKLDPLSLGWHIGFWNLVGSVGFTLCGALGYGALGHPWMNYQSILATFWGSWSFMIGSVLQLWESVWREDDAGNNKQ